MLLMSLSERLNNSSGRCHCSNAKLCSLISSLVRRGIVVPWCRPMRSGISISNADVGWTDIPLPSFVDQRFRRNGRNSCKNLDCPYYYRDPDCHLSKMFILSVCTRSLLPLQRGHVFIESSSILFEGLRAQF